MPELKEITIEDVLDRQLGQVTAPEQLWSRVGGGARPQRRERVSRRWMWSAVAAMIAGGAAWTLHPTPSVELRSSNATEIREWVRARTSLDVPLRDAGSVHLIGAHATNHGAEIAYREGTLDVVRSSSAVDNHLAAVEEARAGAKLVSWTMRGQSFTVACDDPEQMRAACLLCHS